MKLIHSVMLLGAGVGMWAQTLARPEFEVASIKPSPPLTGPSGTGGVQIDGQQVRCVFLSLKDYIGMAYQMRLYQVQGPEWLGSERFDIVAKLPTESPRDQIPAILQALLAERFQFKMHRDKKDTNVYALTVLKSGLKLQES